MPSIMIINMYLTLHGSSLCFFCSDHGVPVLCLQTFPHFSDGNNYACTLYTTAINIMFCLQVIYVLFVCFCKKTRRTTIGYQTTYTAAKRTQCPPQPLIQLFLFIRNNSLLSDCDAMRCDGRGWLIRFDSIRGACETNSIQFIGCKCT